MLLPLLLAGAGLTGGAIMWPRGESGADVLNRYTDIDSPVNNIATLFPTDEIESIRSAGTTIGSGIGAGIHRQKQLGLSRARGAANTPSRVAAARATRMRMNDLSQRLQYAVNARRKQQEVGRIGQTLQALAQRQSMVGQYIASKKQSDFSYARGLADIQAQQNASKKRAAMKIATTGILAGVGVGMLGAGGAAAEVGKIGVGSALGSLGSFGQTPKYSSPGSWQPPQLNVQSQPSLGGGGLFPSEPDPNSADPWKWRW